MKGEKVTIEVEHDKMGLFYIALCDARDRLDHGTMLIDSCIEYILNNYKYAVDHLISE